MSPIIKGGAIKKADSPTPTPAPLKNAPHLPHLPHADEVPTLTSAEKRNPPRPPIKK